MSFIDKIFGNKKGGLHKILVDGNTFYVPEEVKWAYGGGEYYEENFIYWLDKVVKGQSNPIFYDVGANYDYYTVRLANHCKEVYSFEPVKAVYEVLGKNITANQLSNVTALNYGVSDSTKQQTINIYSSSGNNSLFNRNIPEGHSLRFVRKETKELVCLQDLIEAQKLLPPTIMKVDVEGAEKLVVEGSLDIIKEHLPTIFIEYSQDTSRDAGYPREDILRIFQNIHKYHIYGISEDYKDHNLYDVPDFDEKKVANLIVSAEPLK